MQHLTFFVVLGLLVFTFGCTDKKNNIAQENRQENNQTVSQSGTSKESSTTAAPEPPLNLEVGTGEIELAAYELHADKLLSAQLSPDLLEQGWVRLFDGFTLAGWSIVGQADWQSKDGVIRVTRGGPSFLVTNFDIADYELKVDFRAGPKTNSGVFLRTAPEPGDVALDCLELNIAPPDNPYPTGSFVKRQKLEPKELGESFDPTMWHTFHVRLEGESVKVSLDGKPLLEIEDETSSRRGYISLQHNQGVVEFRNILLRPIAAETLKVDNNWQEDWIAAAKEEGQFKVEATSNGLHIVGGLGKVQSKASFGDFLLQARYTLANPEVNSGIFFRCVEDGMLDGYECQVNHALKGDDPLVAKDAGAGAFFRRKDARIVIGDGKTSTYVSILATGNQMVSWVNGVLTAEFVDERPADKNPRRGSRVTAGPIALQGHDATTDVTFEKIQVTPLR